VKSCVKQNQGKTVLAEDRLRIVLPMCANTTSGTLCLTRTPIPTYTCIDRTNKSPYGIRSIPELRGAPAGLHPLAGGRRSWHRSTAKGHRPVPPEMKKIKSLQNGSSSCMNLLKTCIVLSLGCTFGFINPAFSQSSDKTGACNYQSNSLIYLPKRTDIKFYPTSLTHYDKGIIFTVCDNENSSVFFKIDCVSSSMYVLQRDNTYKLHTTFKSNSAGAAMCKKYF